ncbi:MAG TPA: hypothetical protein VGE39_19865 [Prosthecobacter sp.]
MCDPYLKIPTMRLSRRARYNAAEREWQRQQAAKRAQRAPTFALLGTLITGVAALLRAVGLYQTAQAVRQVKFTGDPLAMALVDKEMMITVTRALGGAADLLGSGNLVLLFGGGLLTHALHFGGFRKRWFFWTTLVFALFFVIQPYVGTLFGIWWLCLLIVKRCEFFAKQAILISA